jgi:hypothetical protein
MPLLPCQVGPDPRPVPPLRRARTPLMAYEWIQMGPEITLTPPGVFLIDFDSVAPAARVRVDGSVVATVQDARDAVRGSHITVGQGQTVTCEVLLPPGSKPFGHFGVTWIGEVNG